MLAVVLSSCRSVYDITVLPKYDRPPPAGSRPTQKVQVLVPGPPDPPQIWTRRSRHRHSDSSTVEGGDDEALIEWTEPRLNGSKVAGYQVYVNGKKTGSILASNHRKAIIPLKGKRSVLSCILYDCLCFIICNHVLCVLFYLAILLMTAMYSVLHILAECFFSVFVYCI